MGVDQSVKPQSSTKMDIDLSSVMIEKSKGGMIYKIVEKKNGSPKKTYAYFKDKKNAEECLKEFPSYSLETMGRLRGKLYTNIYKRISVTGYGIFDNWLDSFVHKIICGIIGTRCEGNLYYDDPELTQLLRIDRKKAMEQKHSETVRRKQAFQTKKEESKKRKREKEEVKKLKKEDKLRFLLAASEQTQDDEDLRHQQQQPKDHNSLLRLLSTAVSMKPSVSSKPQSKFSSRSPKIIELQKEYHHTLSQTIKGLQTKRPNLLLVDDFWRDRIPLPPDTNIYISEYADIHDSVVLPIQDNMGLFAKVLIPKNTLMGPYPAFLYKDDPDHPTQRSFDLDLKGKKYNWDIGVDLKHTGSAHYLDYVNSITLDVGDPSHRRFEIFLKEVLTQLGKNPEDFIVPSERLNCTSVNIDPTLKQLTESYQGGWFYKTLKPIEAGEEMVINYGKGYLNHLVSTLLYSDWKERLSGTDEEKIAFHRLSLCWLFSQQKVVKKEVMEDLRALERLYTDYPDILAQIYPFMKDPLLLKNPCDDIANWKLKIPTTTTTKRTLDLLSSPAPPTEMHKTMKRIRQDQRRKNLLQIVEPLIGKKLPKQAALLETYNCTLSDLKQIGLTFTYYPEGYHMFERLKRR